MSYSEQHFEDDALEDDQELKHGLSVEDFEEGLDDLEPFMSATYGDRKLIEARKHILDQSVVDEISRILGGELYPSLIDNSGNTRWLIRGGSFVVKLISFNPKSDFSVAGMAKVRVESAVIGAGLHENRLNVIQGITSITTNDLTQINPDTPPYIRFVHQEGNQWAQLLIDRNGSTDARSILTFQEKN